MLEFFFRKADAISVVAVFFFSAIVRAD